MGTAVSPRSWRSLGAAERKIVVERIIVLRGQGVKNKYIALDLQLRFSTVHDLVRVLKQQGRIPPRRRGQGNPKKGTGFWANLADPRTQQIRQMFQQRKTCQQIGTAAGLSAGRVHEVIVAMRKLHGEQVFDPPTPIYNLGQVVRMCNVKSARLLAICQEEHIPYGRQGKGRSNEEYIFSDEALQAIRTALRHRREKPCRYCRRPMHRTASPNRKVCLRRACRRRYERDRNAKKLKAKTEK